MSNLVRQGEPLLGRRISTVEEDDPPPVIRDEAGTQGAVAGFEGEGNLPPAQPALDVLRPGTGQRNEGNRQGPGQRRPQVARERLRPARRFPELARRLADPERSAHRSVSSGWSGAAAESGARSDSLGLAPPLSSLPSAGSLPVGEAGRAAAGPGQSGWIRPRAAQRPPTRPARRRASSASAWRTISARTSARSPKRPAIAAMSA